MEEDGWSRVLDAYCERTGPEFWSEPLNALTNAAFLVAAAVMWRRTRGGRTPTAAALVVLLGAIGVGSFLYHTVATVWAAMADIVPIALFVLVYAVGANLRFWGWHGWGAALGTLLLVPYAVLASAAFEQLPFFAASAPYWPIALLLALYGAGLMGRAPEAGRGLLGGAGLLTASLVLRSLDGPLCGAFPLGTHFLWHLLNAVVLGWLIEVYRRRVEAAPGPGEDPDAELEDAAEAGSGVGALEEPSDGR